MARQRPRAGIFGLIKTGRPVRVHRREERASAVSGIYPVTGCFPATELLNNAHGAAKLYRHSRIGGSSTSAVHKRAPSFPIPPPAALLGTYQEAVGIRD